MKKILTILFVLCAAISRAQYPLTQNLASDSTLVTIGKNSMGTIKGGIIPMAFTDTTAANLTRIKDYGGSIIWTTSDSSLWVRNRAAGPSQTSSTQYWFKIGGAGGGATGSFWNLTGNTIAAVPAGFGIGTNSADNLPFKTDNTTRLILPSTGLARQSGGAWKSMMFDTTNFTWGYGDGTNIYNSDGTLSGNRTVTTGGNEINFYTDASNYFKYTPSTRIFDILVTNGDYSSNFYVDDFGGIFGRSDLASVSGNGGFFNLAPDLSYLELGYKGNTGGLLNQVGSDDFISMLLAIENPYVGLAIDSANGVFIGKGLSTNDYQSIRGLRVLPNWQIYMDSIDAGGTANDSVLVVQSDGKVVRRNASAFSGGSYTASNGLTLSGSNFKLGGTLGENTTITQDGFTLGISDLLNFADTTNWKPVVVNTTGSGATAGTLRKATYWPVGSGGGGSPAGNFGNLQINRNGAFATPGSDSLDFESATGLTVKGGIRGTTLGVNGAAPTATYAADIVSDGTYTTNLRLSNAATPTSFLTMNSVYGDVLRYISTFNGVQMDIPIASGVLDIVQGANKIFSYTRDDGAYATRRLQAKQGADVSSAGNLTLGNDGNVFEITGTTTINLIANTNWQNGAVIRLVFASTPTVTNNAGTSGSNINILLAGGANFSATANDILTLMLCEIGGTQNWVEVSRSVN